MAVSQWQNRSHFGNGKAESGFTPGLAIVFRREYSVTDLLKLLYNVADFLMLPHTDSLPCLQTGGHYGANFL
jgi:hypothetical protein